MVFQKEKKPKHEKWNKCICSYWFESKTGVFVPLMCFVIDIHVQGFFSMLIAHYWTVINCYIPSSLLSSYIQGLLDKR
jgi:hypothetical protein